MAVFTRVLRDELQTWLTDYSVGTLTDFRGIESGIENTNYFVTTSEGESSHLVRSMKPQELRSTSTSWASREPRHSLPAPHCKSAKSIYRRVRVTGEFSQQARRHAVLKPTPMHCAKVGKSLRMHLAGKSYPISMDNPRAPRGASKRPRAVGISDRRRKRIAAKRTGLPKSARTFGTAARRSSRRLFRDNVLFRAATSVASSISFCRRRLLDLRCRRQRQRLVYDIPRRN